MKIEKKYKGSLKLASIGDALGWMTEFQKSKESLKRTFGVDYIDTFHDWKKNVGGRFHGYVDGLKAGSYSDDTQLLLSVARSVKDDGSVDQYYFAKSELPDWLLYSRGAGRTIKNAARKIQRKSASWNSNFFTFKVGKTTVDYRESGANGAAMRVLPIALANFSDSKKIQEEIFCNSIITHGHPRAILGAMLYGYSINTILKIKPDDFSHNVFLTELGENIHQKFSVNFVSNDKLRDWEKQWNKNVKTPFKDLFKSILDETQEYLRTIYKGLINNASDFDVLTRLGCYENETKGSGTSTVLAGIYFTCKYSSQPLKGIEQAVNSIGTDTDSIAAFAGGLIGALHGESVIPLKWYKVQDSDYIDHMAIRLLNISQNRATKDRLFQKEESKNISKVNSDIFEINDRVFLNTLGNGKVNSIDIQKPITKGKYNLILDVEFDIGQSCRFAKLLNLEEKKTGLLEKYFNDELNLFADLNFKKDTKKQIEQFMSKLTETNQKEFSEIIKIIVNEINNS
ncbi:ADP-ribosylglycohydrolase family protein [Marinicella gelatinilytica]|uniref:ADP-ribosylglycohydrolase family protein n=1 Tax=Marinicella gelatinilytica TaxID=2996017 RepID=UPI002260AF94|nr:ADP-ribosylglycohydrolase family protein [Marinicella gelatinilytica]MCX7545351.1 ADP-ribosylglycohydrolase family protein [Marinicella gelatinilytica]